MKHKIPCFCDNTFVIDAPEEINLDTDPQHIEDILAGNFMNYTCTNCGKKHKPEFVLAVNWPSKNLNLEVLPELDRGGFYRRKEEKEAAQETVISYPEMAERIAMVKDGLVTEAVEALKYYLFVKADENYPEEDISVWYHSKNESGFEFHIHGIKDNEVAVMHIPPALYEKTLGDFQGNSKTEPFPSLRVKSYCSIQNMLRPDELK
ncbi:MAG: CpXC domain-containing protein [Treponema sp.]|nr:CpXC domain-containing protein [Treponema sp.]